LPYLKKKKKEKEKGEEEEEEENVCTHMFLNASRSAPFQPSEKTTLQK